MENVLEGQIDMFPAARRTDPKTSKQAADDVTVSGQRRRDVDRVAEAVRAHKGSTARELANFAKLDYEMVHKRLPDAERLGLLFRAGDRRCSRTQKKAVLWWPR